MECDQKQCVHLYLYSAIVRVQQQLGQSHNLRCAVPAIRTVHQDRPVVPVHSMDNQKRCLQQKGQMLQPFGALQCGKPAAKKRQQRAQTHQRILKRSFSVSCKDLGLPAQSVQATHVTALKASPKYAIISFVMRIVSYNYRIHI